MREPMTRGRSVNLLPVPKRSQRLLVHEGFKDKALAIKAKIKPWLQVRQDRRLVISAIILYTLGEITPRGKDPRVLG